MDTPVKNTTRTNVVVEDLIRGDFQKEGTITAQLRQVVTTETTYPGITVNSNMQQNVFDASEFDAQPQTFTNEENRVAFLNVPEGKTKEEVQAKIASNAVLYKVLSNSPILTDNHRNAIARGLLTMDKIADSQAVRYPEGSEKAGQLILDEHGNPQYRKVFFWNSPKEDQDLRGGDVYMSEAIATELNREVATVVEEQQTDPPVFG